MSYSRTLADRVRQSLRPFHGITERKMFGCVCFMLTGKLLVGIWKQSLIVRLGPEQAAIALKQAHVRPFDATGRPMKGWIVVDPDGLESDRQLAGWLDMAIAFVEALPGK